MLTRAQFESGAKIKYRNRIIIKHGPGDFLVETRMSHMFDSFKTLAVAKKHIDKIRPSIASVGGGVIWLNIRRSK